MQSIKGTQSFQDDLYLLFSIFLSSSLVPDVGSESVSATLTSLSDQNKDDFDMFAQTRSSSLAEQRKKYVTIKSVLRTCFKISKPILADTLLCKFQRQ